MARDDVQVSASSAAQGSARQAEPTRRKRKAWAPSDNDELIFQWVKLDGKSQAFVAEAFGISQPTVSRIVERYERWQAHAGPREEGRLDPAERLRAQRWLTYQRNEKIIAKCLRLADELEGFTDVSRSVNSRPASDPQADRNIRTEWSVLDRTGMVSRYMRLAFRVNMEQLKLAELEPAAMPEALDEEELAEQAAQAAAERAEIEAARQRNRPLVAEGGSVRDQLQRAQAAAEAARQEAEAARAEAAAARKELDHVYREIDAILADEDQSGSGAERETDGATQGAELAIRETGESAVVELKLNNVNNLNGAKSGANAGGPCVCAAEGEQKEIPRSVNNGRAGSGGEEPARPSRGEFMRFIPAG